MPSFREVIPSYARRIPGAILWTAGIIVVAIVVIFTFSFADEPLRSRMEAQMNAKLKGYSVQVPKAHFQLFGLSSTLEDVTIAQQNDTGPAVLLIPKIRASLQWRELLSFHLVADVQVDKPRVYLNLGQVRREVSDSVDLDDRGWQDALAELHPFKINLIEVQEAEVTYIDNPKSKPLTVTQLNLRASNIRNIHDKNEPNPSELHADGVVFGTGHFAIDGNADFLAKPTPAVQFDYTANGIPLEDLTPVTSHVSVKLKGGTIASNGSIETGPNGIGAHIRNVTVNGVRVDYMQRMQAALAGVAKGAEKAAEKRRYTLIVDTVAVEHSQFGVTRQRSSHSYRLFLTDASFHLRNYSNHFVKGRGDAILRGRFMGKGRTAVRMQFRPAPKGLNFGIAVAVDSTPLVTMNELLLAHASLDVSRGMFSFYSELDVRDGRMTGYVKPIVKDIKIYDEKQDRHNPVLAQLWELILQGAAKLFENKKTHELATKATINGPVGETTADTWEVIGNAWTNAFISAIRPGFDKVKGVKVGSGGTP